MEDGEDDDGEGGSGKGGKSMEDGEDDDGEGGSVGEGCRAPIILLSLSGNDDGSDTRKARGNGALSSFDRYVSSVPIHTGPELTALPQRHKLQVQCECKTAGEKENTQLKRRTNTKSATSSSFTSLFSFFLFVHFKRNNYRREINASAKRAGA